MPTYNKKTIRQTLLEKRQSLSIQDSEILSQQIIQKILAWDIFKSAHHISLYHTFRKEVNLEPLWLAAHQLGKKTYFPVISSDSADKSMSFLEASPDDKYILNRFNIKEPLPNSPTMPIEKLDCLFIPLVAFDQEGYRLGMGQGYYDRALANTTVCRIGVAYSFQEVEQMPHDRWDIPLDFIVTEKELFSF